MDKEEAIRCRFLVVRDSLDERGRRLFAAAEATVSGIAAVSRATGIARSTIGRGIKELKACQQLPGRIRRAGAGRRFRADEDPTLLEDLRKTVEPSTMGDPMRPLVWVSKSRVKLSDALKEMGHDVSPNTIPILLERLDYRRQVNRKTKEGANHPDRDAQFEHINSQAIDFQNNEQPVISIDCKKKELVGDFKSNGSDYRPSGCPDQVQVHDFINKDLGKAVPYGVYDIATNEGWITVGIDHDTAEFAVNSIRCWWDRMGKQRYPTAHSILITCDGGGSNGSRVRLWKRELQRLSNETGISITVCHYPPGTSKWNKIEHRLFCHISQNWRGQPLINRQVIVDLIAKTTTKTGLLVRSELDTRNYEKAIKVTEAEMNSLNIERNTWHPDWNYSIRPQESDGSKVML